MGKAIDITSDELKLGAMEPLICETEGAMLDVYPKDDFETETKGDDAPVSKADLDAHNILVVELKAITPDIPVVSEEGAD